MEEAILAAEGVSIHWEVTTSNGEILRPAVVAL
jgi:hypothetical protein